MKIHRTGRVLRAWPILALLMGLGCEGSKEEGMHMAREGAGDERVIHASDILAVLKAQEEAWNRGDIESFMKGYWNSPHMTFSSRGEMKRGWIPTLERYRTEYPTKEKMGRLRFDDFEATALGSDHALVTGSWSLKREEPIGGVFTLIFRRFPEGWRIIHDHTSALPAATPAS